MPNRIHNKCDVLVWLPLFVHRMGRCHPLGVAVNMARQYEHSQVGNILVRRSGEYMCIVYLGLGHTVCWPPQHPSCPFSICAPGSACHDSCLNSQARMQPLKRGSQSEAHFRTEFLLHIKNMPISCNKSAFPHHTHCDTKGL